MFTRSADALAPTHRARHRRPLPLCPADPVRVLAGRAGRGDRRGRDQPGRHPCHHARLLELGERFQHLCALADAALEIYDQCCEKVRSPQRPEVLRHRLEDHVLGLDLPFDPANAKGGFSADPRRNPFFTPEGDPAVAVTPPPWDLDMVAQQRARIVEIELASKT